MSSSLSDKEKDDLMEKAQCTIILCLGDKPLRKVSREKFASAM